MNTSKIIAVCLFAGGSFFFGHSATAQIRLGAVSTTHLTSAASLNTASMNNALRATNSATTSAAGAVGAAGRGTASAGSATASVAGSATASAAGNAASSAKVSTVKGSRQIEGKTTTAVNVDARSSSADVSIKNSTSASVQKQ